MQLRNRRFGIFKETLQHNWEAVIRDKVYQLNWLMGVRKTLWDSCRCQTGDGKEEVTPYFGSDWIKKVNFTLKQAVKSRKGSRSITLLLFNPGRFTPGKDPEPIVQEAGWPQGRYGRERKISPPPPEFDPRTFEPVVSLYTDWAILSHWRDWVESLNSCVILVGFRLSFEPCTAPHLGRMPHPSPALFFAYTAVTVQFVCGCGSSYKTGTGMAVIRRQCAGYSMFCKYCSKCGCNPDPAHFTPNGVSIHCSLWFLSFMKLASCCMLNKYTALCPLRLVKTTERIFLCKPIL
jgi:hypothetical protein